MAIYRHSASMHCKSCDDTWRFHWVTATNGKVLAGRSPNVCPKCDKTLTKESFMGGNSTPLDLEEGIALVGSER